MIHIWTLKMQVVLEPIVKISIQSVSPVKVLSTLYLIIFDNKLNDIKINKQNIRVFNLV